MSGFTLQHKGAKTWRIRCKLYEGSVYGLHQNTFKINVPSSSSVLWHPNTYFADSKPLPVLHFCPNKNFTAVLKYILAVISRVAKN